MDNMQAEVFNGEKHYDEFCEWWQRRKLLAPPLKMLSQNGVYIKDTACGFLYLTDSSMGIFDAYITNPSAPSDDRKKALDLITMNLLMWAKEMGVSHILTNSQSKNIQQLAIDSGFKACGLSQAFIKEL